MRTITGNKEYLEEHIARKSNGKDIVFPENNKDSHEQADIMTNIHSTFEGDIYTVSPWVISDSEEVYIVNEDLELELFTKFITFGASVNKITMGIFGRRETIGNLALKKLKELKKEFDKGDQTIDEALDAADRYLGESVEKILYLKYVMDSEK